MYSIGWVFEEEADLGNVAHACNLKFHDEDVFYHLMCYNIYNKELVIQALKGELFSGLALLLLQGSSLHTMAFAMGIKC